ncbi:hypothetical protein ACMSD6_09830 [Bacteroides thetaiotaomicron]|uniref:hypothetical protein n=1 Tax=Bacteroides thetaiotaomicron TaxID=818 RepID=UPI0039C11021
MEDKRISEKESLELIARMIRETQDNTARYAAYPLLIWGYTTVAISLVVWYFYLQTGVWQINFLWFALPVIAGPLTIFFNRKDKNKGAKKLHRPGDWSDMGCVWSSRFLSVLHGICCPY